MHFSMYGFPPYLNVDPVHFSPFMAHWCAIPRSIGSPPWMTLDG